jgi:hypothetical protein
VPLRLFHWTIERTAAQHTNCSRATRLHACDGFGAAVPLRYDYDAMKRNRCGPQRANVLTRVASPITLPRRGAKSYCVQPHTRQPNRCRRAATAAREASGEWRGAARLGSGQRRAAAADRPFAAGPLCVRAGHATTPHLLRRRLHAVEAARDAQLYGLILGTLGRHAARTVPLRPCASAS